MEQLNYAVLEKQGFAGYLLREAPERILQFGEGNFLRAFVDYFIDVANEKCGFDSKVAVVQPIARGLAETLNRQQGLYTLYLRGVEGGRAISEKRVVSCIGRALDPYSDPESVLRCAENPHLRYVVSNTTEAGIVFDESCAFTDAPPAAFPAKLTQFLYRRFRTVGVGYGLVILSCELIDRNGDELKKCVHRYIDLWGMEERFARWVDEENLFCNTLVDRIVTGYPAAEADTLNAENGCEDQLLDTGEIFGLWVIEGPESLARELPFARADLPVRVVEDHTPYKQRKVRILNGAHTGMVAAAYLSGKNTVRDCMEDEDIRSFMETAVFREIIPTLSLPEPELRAFAASVTERFQNPFLDHSLLAIALNSTSKWRARVLPSVREYVKRTGALAPNLTFSFAAYLAFYRGIRMTDAGMAALRDGEEYIVKDDRWVLELFLRHKDSPAAQLVDVVCADERMWGEDLREIPGFAAKVAEYLEAIEESGMRSALMRQAEGGMT